MQVIELGPASIGEPTRQTVTRILDLVGHGDGHEQSRQLTSSVLTIPNVEPQLRPRDLPSTNLYACGTLPKIEKAQLPP